jgi:hypothetical protein
MNHSFNAGHVTSAVVAEAFQFMSSGPDEALSQLTTGGS